jgi:hypothetical protein
VEPTEISAWFDEYLAAFAACGRGESDDLDALLHYYGVPLLLTTDEAAFALTTADAVLRGIGPQIDGMRAAGFDDTEILSSEAVALNATTATFKAALSRRRADGSEIGRFVATYLITDGADGRRISALLVHGAS